MASDNRSTPLNAIKVVDAKFKFGRLGRTPIVFTAPKVHGG